MAISLIGYGSKEIDGARIKKNKIDYNFAIEQNPDQYEQIYEKTVARDLRKRGAIEKQPELMKDQMKEI